MNKIFRFGEKNAEIKNIQKRLNDCIPLKEPLIIDGVFGIKTFEAVVKFQQKSGLKDDGIIGLETLGALDLLPPIKKEDPKFLMIHCTATQAIPSGLKAADIIKYHTLNLRWDRPGYSRIIELDGNIVESWALNLNDGFQPWEITYGAAEYNPFSIHFCYIGGIDFEGNPKNTLNEKQSESLKKLVLEVVDKCPDILIGGHNQFHNKACPSFWVPDYLKDFINDKNIFKEDKFGYKEIFS